MDKMFIQSVNLWILHVLYQHNGIQTDQFTKKCCLRNAVVAIRKLRLCADSADEGVQTSSNQRLWARLRGIPLFVEMGPFNGAQNLPLWDLVLSEVQT